MPKKSNKKKPSKEPYQLSPHQKGMLHEAAADRQVARDLYDMANKYNEKASRVTADLWASVRHGMIESGHLGKNARCKVLSITNDENVIVVEPQNEKEGELTRKYKEGLEKKVRDIK